MLNLVALGNFCCNCLSNSPPPFFSFNASVNELETNGFLYCSQTLPMQGAYKQSFGYATWALCWS